MEDLFQRNHEEATNRKNKKLFVFCDLDRRGNISTSMNKFLVVTNYLNHPHIRIQL
ncbi:hypothetical protein KFK09_023830 [Dendrobium nobile]|uniref:Uncharacterized protein n=1 Tax=Dendrobium nobile TaxID=94219 RepID=A0A8T3AAW1_DENNO|nr:hypothetical protein KFK09_023830 [Dendrobium nobile]